MDILKDKHLSPVIRVFISHGEIFWGPGMRELLALVRDTGSVRLACSRMNMSYSKGWKLINALERHVGFQVVVRRQGGKGGGEAHLTPDGSKMLDCFEAYEQECCTVSADIFKRHFGK